MKAKQSAVRSKVMLDLESQTKVSGWDLAADGAPWRVWEQGRVGLISNYGNSPSSSAGRVGWQRGPRGGLQKESCHQPSADEGHVG